jgi:small subunit ribosomal protein S4
VDIPSFLVSVGDVVKVKEKSASSPKFKAMIEAAPTVAKWVEVNAESLEGKVVTLPTREDIDIPIAEHLIVELYSR